MHWPLGHQLRWWLGDSHSPSTDMVIYALMQGISGKMFAGGIFPRLLLLVLDSIYILIRAYFQPDIAPALPKEERGDWKEKLRAGKALILPFAVIFLGSGNNSDGGCHPHGGAAMGVLGSVVAAVVIGDFRGPCSDRLPNAPFRFR